MEDASNRLRVCGPQPPIRLSRFCDIAAAVLLALSLVFVLWTFRDYGTTLDEWVNQESGELTLKLYASLGADQRANHFIDLYYYGPWYQVLVALAYKVLPSASFDTRHLLGGLAGVVTTIASWLLGRQTLGAAGGLLTLIFLLTTGYFVGNIFNDPIDTPFMLAMTVSLVTINRYLRHIDEPGWEKALWVGLAVGLAFATRIGGVMFLLNLALCQTIYLASRRPANTSSPRPTVILRRFFAHDLLIGLVALVVTYLLWPWLWPDPIRLLLQAAEHFSRMPVEFDFPFFGLTVRSTDLPAWYIPGNLLVRLPEAFLFGLLVLPIAWLATRRVAWEPKDLRRTLVRLNVGLGWILPLAIVIVVRPVLYDGFRHLLFILPPLAVSAAGGVLLVLGRWRRLGIAFAFALAVSLGFSVSTLIGLHPYEYLYFNRFVGGPAGAEGHFVMDYWGATAAEAVRTLARRLSAEQGEDVSNRPIAVEIYNPWDDDFTRGVIPPAWRAVLDASSHPDFAILYGGNSTEYASYPVYAEVTRLGIVLATVRDLRHGPVTP